MAHRLNRAHLVRTAVVVAAVAVPLGAAGSAQAAIAGATPASTSVLPDLVSATSNGSTTMVVCYDKALGTNSPAFSNAQDIYVTNYLSGTAVTATPEYPTTITLASNPDCANLQFGALSGQLSLGQGTAVTSVADAVTAASGNGQSLADSTTVTSGTSHVGTAGITAGPDLTGGALYTGSTTITGSAGQSASTTFNNAITYTFDQTVDPANVDPADFFYESTTPANTAAGTKATTTLTTGTGYSVSGNTVTVQFGTTAPTSTTSVTNAEQVGVTYTPAAGTTAASHAVYSAVNGTPADEVGNQNNNVALTNRGSGTVSIPTLTSATLANNYTAVTYTFDHAISTTVDPADFFVALSDGSDVTGVAATATAAGTPYSVSGNSVTVTYGSALSSIAEYAVQANVASGAVSLATPDGTAAPLTNTPGGTTIGGNAGAFSRGYTTGPDVTSAVSLGSSAVQITVDQRVAGFGVNNTDLGFIYLLNAAGQQVDADPSATYSSAPAPGPEVIDLQFSPTVTTGTQIQFNTGALETNLDDNDGYNIPQIVGISGGSAARVHAAHVKHHAKKHSKKHAKKKA